MLFSSADAPMIAMLRGANNRSSETDSAGLNNDADQTLSPEQIDWADVIFVMERDHLTKLRRNFTRHAAGKRVICLNIADDYGYLQPELIKLLEARVGPFLRQA